MARKLRIEFPGAVYHAYTRGNGYRRIFMDDFDCRIYLNLLTEASERFNWRIFSYNLMVNHNHLSLQTVEANLSRGMGWLNSVYALRFNRRHGTVGHLFQGRFQDTLVQNDSHLLVLNRYIALNPVRKKWVGRPEEWRWSSYAALIGRRDPHPCLDVEGALSMHDGPISRARKEFESFVLAGIGEEPPGIYQPIFGDDDFVKRQEDHLSAKKDEFEFPAEQRLATRPGLDELIPAVPAYDRSAGAARNEAIFRAVTEFGYSQKEISDHSGLHYARISQIVKRERRKVIKLKI